MLTRRPPCWLLAVLVCTATAWAQEKKETKDAKDKATSGPSIFQVAGHPEKFDQKKVEFTRVFVNGSVSWRGDVGVIHVTNERGDSPVGLTFAVSRSMANAMIEAGIKPMRAPAKLLCRIGSKGDAKDSTQKNWYAYVLELEFVGPPGKKALATFKSE